jgi:dTDP-4-dehydrorhamnose 3,5-epimerase
VGEQASPHATTGVHVIFQETGLKGAFVVDLERKEDERGFFARTWCQKEFEAHGLNPRLVQAGLSYNRLRGTLRGLHYQATPFQEAKLIRCLRGGIYDVIVDLRPESPTYLRWIGIDLNAENRTMLYIPEGFAHGFQTLADETEVFYQMTQFYEPGAERGARWDDPAFSICWPEVENRVISARDRSWPLFEPGQPPPLDTINATSDGPLKVAPPDSV